MKKHVLRVKHFAEETFSRTGKIEEPNDELQLAERKVEQIKLALQVLCKRLGTTTGAGPSGQPQDSAAREKRLKKIPEYVLGLALKDNNSKDNDTFNNLFKYILQECGDTEVMLANEIAEHELKVEQMVLAQFNSVNEQEIPTISKAKKHFTKCIGDRDSANSRYLSLQRQSEANPGSLAAKVNQAKLELEEAETKAELARDNLAVEMFKLLSKEIHFANLMLQYLKLQKAYHASALHSLTDIVPRLEQYINSSEAKPIFGFPIEKHLEISNRTIAFPIELCVCALHELGLEEEGLFRIAGGNTRTKRMKLSLDSGMFTLPLLPQYRDVHIISGVLKSYLRDLPEPLLTTELYSSFVSAIANNTTEESRLTALWEVVHKLPEANFNNLRYLIKFLSVLSKNQAVNKMTPSNVAIVIAPNLLRNDNSMSDTSTINCVVELLVKHSDWFFKEDVDFFVSFTKEQLLPDLYEYGFTPNFGKGVYNKSFNPNHDPATTTEETLSKSMYEYQDDKQSVSSKQQSHSRSNSHDSSLILLDNGLKKKAQSNTSLCDQSSPPPDSPKPVMKKKNKPAAPVPPNFTPPDKNKESPIKSDRGVASPKNEPQVKSSKIEPDRPDKPPRPAVPDAIKHVAGVQTLNRSTYNKNKHLNKMVNKLSSSRESLTDRRNSIENERQAKADPVVENVPIPTLNSIESIVVQHGTVEKVMMRPDATHDNPLMRNSMTSFLPAKPQEPAKFAKPVAAPRTTLASKQDSSTEIENITAEVQLRPKSAIEPSLAPIAGSKPAIPERPAMLRPSSFRNSTQKISSLEMLNVENPGNPGEGTTATTLERIHSYTVDKQQPTIIQVVGSPTSGRLSDPAVLSSPDATAEIRVANPAQRTNSTGSQLAGEFAESGGSSAKSSLLSGQMRKMSQSEGNILDVPPSPRPYHRIPRPQIPAPPPPTSVAVVESTNL